MSSSASLMTLLERSAYLGSGAALNVTSGYPEGLSPRWMTDYQLHPPADFLDVPSSQQFYFYVTTLVSNGITAGIGGGLYGVDDDTLRQQMAVFILKGKHG